MKKQKDKFQWEKEQESDLRRANRGKRTKFTSRFDYKTHGDFKKYYDTTQKRNIWILGYFGGGSVNISQALPIARDYARENNVPFNKVTIDEILSSRRHKGFKFISSTVEQEKGKEVKDEDVMENVYAWLRD